MSNLMNTLMGGMLSSDSLQSLSNKSGADASQVEGVVQSALPVLLQSMVNNSQGGQGEQALSQALNDHSQRSGSLEQQVQNADLTDGSKILGHLLGGKQSTVESQLAEHSGLQTNQVSTILAAMAPALLSSVGKQGPQSAATNQNMAANNLSGGLMEMLTGAVGQGGQSGSGILDMFTGGMATAGQSKQEGSNILSSLSGLFGGK